MKLAGYVADVQPEIEVLMTQNLAEALATSSGVAGLEPDKRYIAAVNTACNKTCAGQEWLELMIRELQKAPPWIYDLWLSGRRWTTSGSAMVERCRADDVSDFQFVLLDKWCCCGSVRSPATLWDAC